MPVSSKGPERKQTGSSLRPSIAPSLAVQCPHPLGHPIAVLFIKILFKTGDFWPKQSFLMLFLKCCFFYSALVRMGAEEGGREEDLEILQIAQSSLFTTSDKAVSVFPL